MTDTRGLESQIVVFIYISCVNCHIFYRIEREGFLIEEVESGGDDALFDGLVRAVCDAAVQSGSDRVRFSPAVSRETLAKLGVPLDGEGVLTGLSAFLRNCKHCKSC